MILYGGARYVRGGKCNRCGQCCADEDCEHFEKFGVGEITICKIFDSPDRPLKCKWFPEAPPITFERCGYHFLDTWEDNRIVGVKEV